MKIVNDGCQTSQVSRKRSQPAAQIKQPLSNKIAKISKGLLELPQDVLTEIICFVGDPIMSSVSKCSQQAVNNAYPFLTKSLAKRVQLSHRLSTNFDTLSKDRQLKTAKHAYKALRRENDECLIKSYKQLIQNNLVRFDIRSYIPLVDLPRELPFVKKAKRVRDWMKAHAEALGRLDTLFLEKAKLTMLPYEITHYLTHLKTLDIAWNKITELSTEIGNFQELEQLNIAYNRIKNIPPEIGKFKKLKRFNCAGNKIEKIPPEIGELKKLKRFNCARNKIEKIPPEIGELKRLEKFNCSENKIEDIPEELNKCKELMVFEPSGNKKIKIECGQFTDLSKVKFLNLSKNKEIKKFPLAAQSSLEFLFINGTSIPGRAILSIVRECPKLFEIVIDSTQNAALSDVFKKYLLRNGISLIVQDN